MLNTAQLGHKNPTKVHYMWRHVEEQMKRYTGGLGDMMEDRVKREHQVGKRYCSRLSALQSLTQRSKARAKLVHRNNNPKAMAHVMSVQNA